MKNKPLSIPEQICLSMMIVLFLSGCSGNETMDHEFGESVRSVIAMQTANPRSRDIGMDGTKAGLALQKYQRDVGDPKKIDQQEIAPVSVGTQ